MQVDNTIRVGQLVRINAKSSGDSHDKVYLVIGKYGGNCELLAVNETKSSKRRRWWTEDGLSVWV